MAYIHTIGDDEATGPLKRLFDAAIARAGKVFNVVRIGGLKPDFVRRHLALYRTVMYEDSGLTRAEREMLAVITSHVNGCHY